jgi:zinc resistance-associated protein
MLKPVLAGATALLIAGSSLVYAQQRPAASGAEPHTTGAREHGPRGRMSAEDAQAFADARIAALKAGLKLTPEQEKNWPAVETAMRDLAKTRVDRMNARREARKDDDGKRDPIQRMRQRADMMTESAAGLKKLADASEPLYKSLDDAQKRRLTVLTREAMRGGWRGDHGPRGRHHRL